MSTNLIKKRRNNTTEMTFPNRICSQKKITSYNVLCILTEVFYFFFKETKRKQHRERSNGKKPSFSRIVAGKAALVLRHEGASSEATHGLQPTLEGSTDWSTFKANCAMLCFIFWDDFKRHDLPRSCDIFEDHTKILKPGKKKIMTSRYLISFLRFS